jgi:hypothetical protein
MKVLDLQCANAHTFEGWFASEDDFQAQCASAMVQCPLCGSGAITKKLSAPRLSLSGHSVSAEQQSQVVEPTLQPDQRIAAAWMELARHVIANSADVGNQFAEEARKMHYGEAEVRNIRGNATAQEKMALADEGIDVMTLTIPDILKEPLQ